MIQCANTWLGASTILDSNPEQSVMTRSLKVETFVQICLLIFTPNSSCAKNIAPDLLRQVYSFHREQLNSHKRAFGEMPTLVGELRSLGRKLAGMWFAFRSHCKVNLKLNSLLNHPKDGKANAWETTNSSFL